MLFDVGYPRGGCFVQRCEMLTGCILIGDATLFVDSTFIVRAAARALLIKLRCRVYLPLF